jgi:hypothetical protein
MENKLERLGLLIDALTMQAQTETDPKRRRKLIENVERLTKRYIEEQGKGETNGQQ